LDSASASESLLSSYISVYISVSITRPSPQEEEAPSIDMTSILPVAELRQAHMFKRSYTENINKTINNRKRAQMTKYFLILKIPRDRVFYHSILRPQEEL
jgi:hypothetical protein